MAAARGDTGVMRVGIIKLVCCLFLLFVGVGALSQPVSAQAAPSTPASEACGGEGRYLLGVIPSWDRGLGSCEDIAFEEFLEGQKVKLIITNVLTIMISVGAIVAVAFVIVGGFSFILSSGNSEKAVNARKTIINSLIGLVILLMGRAVAEIVYNQLTTL